MNRIQFLFIAFLFSSQIFSQTSPLEPVCTFNYQAVARGADDNVIANQAVTIQFTILDGPGANELYIEEHETSTSSLGLINLEVGAGTRTGGSMVFQAIPWIIRKHFLKVDMKMDGTGDFINLGEAPILAVPIAISAKVAGSAVITLDTIKRIDTLRVDTLRVKKVFADVMCVDSIKGKVVIDTIVTESICANGDVIIKNSALILKDAAGKILFQVDEFGDSYHYGLETFDGGLEVRDRLGNPLFQTPMLEQFDFFQFWAPTKISGNLEITDGALEMVNANNDVVFSVDKDGNSYHKGEEVFAGGIVLENPDNNETVVYLDAGADGLTGYAVTVNGNFMLNGLLQAEAKNFLIDHPLNPEEMTLRHYSVESDQMGTVYNGTIEFDENGEATVELPSWFEALNNDFSYQLTCIGGFSNVFIAEEVKNNQFKIGGGKEGMKVSWQVNGVRHDPVSSKHIKPIEEYKTTEYKQ
jgi:hypothetical protein